MQLTDEAKRNILNCVMDRIAAIADKEYQKRVWIRGEGPECDDFDETCCIFFGDGDPMLKNYKDFEITESQYDLLVKFRREFKAFSKANDLPQDFIDISEWEKIMEMATVILEAFNHKKRSTLRFRIDLMIYRFRKNIGIFFRLFTNKKHIVKPESLTREPVCQGSIPTFPRPDGIPENFLVKITNAGVGMQYVHPENKGAYVRVMPGKPYSLLSYQREPYVIQMKDGQALDKSGNLIPAFSPEAHIPIDEFVFRKEYAYL